MKLLVTGRQLHDKAQTHASLKRPTEVSKHIKGCLQSQLYFTKSKRDKEEYTEMGKKIEELSNKVQD